MIQFVIERTCAQPCSHAKYMQLFECDMLGVAILYLEAQRDTMQKQVTHQDAESFQLMFVQL